MQTVSRGDNLHDMSNPGFWENNKKNISICHQLKILPRVLSINKVLLMSTTNIFHSECEKYWHFLVKK